MAAGAVVKLREGERVRATDAGKFGDVGVTNLLDDAVSHQARACVDERERFSETP